MTVAMLDYLSQTYHTIDSEVMSSADPLKADKFRMATWIGIAFFTVVFLAMGLTSWLSYLLKIQ